MGETGHYARTMTHIPNHGKIANRLIWLLVPFAMGLAMPASAQLLPPGGGLPGLGPSGLLQPLPGTIQHTTHRIEPALGNSLNSTVTIARDIVGRPLNNRSAIETIQDIRVVRGEILAIAPTKQALSSAQAMGFILVRQDDLPALGLVATVLQAPDGMDTATALATMRKTDPAGVYDYNHIYNPDGDTARNPRPTQQANRERVSSVGMIDSGIALEHQVFRHGEIEPVCFSGDTPGPATVHGTAIASLLVGEDDGFEGYLPGTRLFAADVYCGEPSGGNAEAIVRALAWLAKSGTAVVNISLSGPPNALLAAAIAAFLKRGHVLVAAVGNDGPAAPQRYPAAYPGVVGVTSVDSHYAIQLDANRGPDVAFAARGVDVRAATLNSEYTTFTGTSFAAPAVAACFAKLVSKPDPDAATRAWVTLEHAAHDLGTSGRDPVFGYGYLPAPVNTTKQANTSAK